MGECSRLLGVICALLDNSILLVESCVSYPVMDRLPLLTHPLLATPAPTTRLIYSTLFIVATRTLDAPTRLNGTTDAVPLDTTFHNTSFLGSPYGNDPAAGACFDW